MKQAPESESEESAPEDEDDPDEEIRVGNGVVDDCEPDKGAAEAMDDAEMQMDDGFDGLEEAAKIVLKKPRLN